jgi:membrane protease YdiL (CAAX protease family)
MNPDMRFLGWATLLGFGLTGLGLVYFFQEVPLPELLTGPWPIPVQLLLGVPAGALAALFAKWIICRPFFSRERVKYQGLINQWPWTPGRILFISVCAGVGEELFFRAGLQPLLGLWTTSLLFVLLHGYLNPFNWKISIYGLAMVGLIAFFGYLFQETGIFTAMAAHAAFDAVLLFWLTSKTR